MTRRRRLRLVPVAKKDRVQASVRADYSKASNPLMSNAKCVARLLCLWQDVKAALTTVTTHLGLGKIFKPIYEEHLWKTYYRGLSLPVGYPTFGACTQDQVGRGGAVIRGCITAYNGLLSLGIVEGSDVYRQAERFGYDTLRVMLALAKDDAVAFRGIVQRSTSEKLSNRDVRSLHDVVRNGGTQEAALKADVATARNCNGQSLSRYVVPLAAPLPHARSATASTDARVIELEPAKESTPIQKKPTRKKPTRKSEIPCRVPGCHTTPRNRGICPRHYNAARTFVKRGLTTWKKLEALGKVLPAHIKTNNSWFLDETAPGRSAGEVG